MNDDGAINNVIMLSRINPNIIPMPFRFICNC